MKKAKIVRIESVKPYTNDFGTTIYHNLEMDNGDKINIGKKKDQQVGWELIYEVIDSGQEYNKAKSGSKQDYDNANTASTTTGQPIQQKSPTSQKQKPYIDINTSIIYQSTMKEVMAFFITEGFDGVASKTDTIQEKMDVVSDTCMYLCQKTLNNIIELS